MSDFLNILKDVFGATAGSGENTLLAAEGRQPPLINKNQFAPPY